MWLTIPDSFQTHMFDRELVNYATGQPATGIVLPTAAQQLATPPSNPIIVQTLAVLTALALDAQTVVQGELLSQGTLVDPLPAGNVNAALLIHVTTHMAFEHLFLRIPGEASQFPTAWEKSIKGAKATLQKFVDGMLPLDTGFFTRGAEVNIPPMAAVIRTHGPVDAAFARDWDLGRRW